MWAEENQIEKSPVAMAATPCRQHRYNTRNKRIELEQQTRYGERMRLQCLHSLHCRLTNRSLQEGQNSGSCKLPVSGPLQCAPDSSLITGLPKGGIVRVTVTVTVTVTRQDGLRSDRTRRPLGRSARWRPCEALTALQQDHRHWPQLR